MSAAWLVSRRFDLAAFVLPAVVALGLVPFAAHLAPGDVMPLWGWFVLVLCVDVAHVWSTLFRTYLDPSELRRRPVLYAAAPLLAYAGGVLFAAVSFEVFWRVMAYLAVFHFIRQQYGWAKLYARGDPGMTSLDRWLDALAIYAATVFPVLWWHAHLPRQFDWFMPGDFVIGLSQSLVEPLWPVYLLSLAGFLSRQVQRGLHEGFVPWGKLWLVATTAACWGVGIIATNSDWAFTVTNVIIHGVPYVAFVWVRGRRDRAQYPEGTLLHRVFTRRGGGLVFGLTLLGLAYGEEYLWDRSLWQDRGSLFPGGGWALDESWVVFWMPLLALPQVTHYILDGYIWRRRPSARAA